MKSIIYLLLALLLCLSAAVQSSARKTYDADAATVYFVITDRFCNGDSANDVTYGRRVDYGSERLNAATVHGGDFKGMLKIAQKYAR